MSPRPALSINLCLKDRRVLLIGSGRGAEERAKRLQAAGAELVRADAPLWREQAAADFFLVVGHTDSDSLNREVAEWARDAGCLRYAHDQPDHSDFSFPALASRGPLHLAISTEGVAPALASRLRAQLETILASGGHRFDAAISELERIRAEFPPGAERRENLRRLASQVRLVGKLEVD